jgi:hypothetical protein
MDKSVNGCAHSLSQGCRRIGRSVKFRIERAAATHGDDVVIDDVGKSNGPAQACIRPSQAQTHAGRLPARRQASALGMQRMDRKSSGRPKPRSPGPHRGCALLTKDHPG